MAWRLAAVMAVAMVAAGIAGLGIRRDPYYVARYWGKGAWLDGAQLAGARLRCADLRDAQLWRADLRHSDLRQARLCGALLTGARLSGANLTGADMRGAILCKGEEFTAMVTLKSLLPPRMAYGPSSSNQVGGADLTRANLTGALYDATTRWPEGFDPHQHGAVLVR